MEVLGLLMDVVDKERIVAPGGLISGDPVDLRGLEFPTVNQCAIQGISDALVSRIAGQQRFSDVAFRRVNLANAKLDFSIWKRCKFYDVSFDRASMDGVKLFGCEFLDCSFARTKLSNASFSVESDGSGTRFTNCIFQNTQFRGATCSNPVFDNTSFLDCRFDQFQFDEAQFISGRIVGIYDELTFRGAPGGIEPNRLRLDLSEAKICWLHANYGIDLGCVTLGDDQSCAVIKAREVAIPVIVTQLVQKLGAKAKGIATMLESIFTSKSISPLSDSQTTVYLSSCMFEELDESLGRQEAESIFKQVREIAKTEGYLPAQLM